MIRWMYYVLMFVIVKWLDILILFKCIILNNFVWVFYNDEIVYILGIIYFVGKYKVLFIWR